MQLEKELDKLKKILKDYENFAVMFSGGIDSSLLLYVCHKFYPEKLVAVTILSATLSAVEQKRIDQVVQDLGVKHQYLTFAELDNQDFVKNDKQRCYYCKKARLEQLQKWAEANKIAVFLDGSNTDDLQDYRPGMLAAQEFPELLVSPFLRANINKLTIRILAQKMGIEFWDLPSSACLASRLAYGLEITAARLQQVERIESYLAKIIPGVIRLRHHGDLARIEITPTNFASLLDENLRKLIIQYCQEQGFSYVTLDLQGYQVGSMNKVIER